VSLGEARLTDAIRAAIAGMPSVVREGHGRARRVRIPVGYRETETPLGRGALDIRVPSALVRE